MKSVVTKVLVSLFVICLVIGIGYQIYLQLSFPYDTSVVYSSTMDKSTVGNGVIFKDEMLLDYQNQGGVVRNLYSNGSRVAAKSEVAKIYKTQEDVSKMAQIDILEKEISSLGEAQSPGVLQDTNIKSINKQINSSYYTLMTNLKSDNLMDLAEEKEKITTLFNKKQIITNQVSNFNDSINQLTAQKQSLEKSITSKPSSITTPEAGCFVDNVDGYEDKCALSSASGLTLKQVKDIFNSQISSNNTGIGKIITNPKLLYKVSLPTKSVSDVKLGIECALKFEETGEEITATLEDVKLERDNPESLTTFSINVMTERLSSIRKSKADIIFKTYKGIKVPKTAVRTNDDGETGVYVVNNISMQFKKIDVVFEDENYVLSKPHSDEKVTYVREYDKVITQGKDLYDNKPIR